jgi:hypothetical protein
MATINPAADVVVDTPVKPDGVSSVAEVGPTTPPISASLGEELRNLLKDSTVLTPNSEGYTESLKRWAESAEKPAVSIAPSHSSNNLTLAGYGNPRSIRPRHLRDCPLLYQTCS